MPTSIKSQAILRKAGLAARRELTPAYRHTASGQILEKIRTSHRFKSSKAVAVYWPMPDEVDVIDLIDIVIAQNRRAYLPIVRQDMTLGFGEVTASTRFCRNQYGIPEPVTTNDSLITARNLHLVITPLSAFDDSGNRIGFGGGYYDRTFGFRRHRTSWLRPRLVGVAFDAQRVAAIKANPWDVTVDAVITENAVYGSGIVI